MPRSPSPRRRTSIARCDGSRRPPTTHGCRSWQAPSWRSPVDPEGAGRPPRDLRRWPRRPRSSTRSSNRWDDVTVRIAQRRTCRSDARYGCRGPPRSHPVTRRLPWRSPPEWGESCRGPGCRYTCWQRSSPTRACTPAFTIPETFWPARFSARRSPNSLPCRPEGDCERDRADPVEDQPDARYDGQRRVADVGVGDDHDPDDDLQQRDDQPQEAASTQRDRAQQANRAHGHEPDTDQQPDRGDRMGRMPDQNDPHDDAEDPRDRGERPMLSRVGERPDELDNPVQQQEDPDDDG